MTTTQATTAAENIALTSGISVQRSQNQLIGDTQRVFEGRQRVLNLTPVLAADGKPGLFLCNYAQGGFAILAADRHMPPVLAFAEHGALPTNLGDGKAASDGLLTWVENTKQIAAALRLNPSAQNTAPGAAAAWTTLLASSAIKDPSGITPNRTPPDPTPKQPGSLQVGPLIQSTWGQDVPYNAQCRFNGVMCQTGCVATSMAQVMRYWQYPARYNWAAMPYQVAPTTGYPELAELMHNIGDSVGMSYGQTASSADSYKIPDGFRSFGYGSADYRDYPNGSSGQNGVFILRGNGVSYYYDVMDNLRHNQPVIFGGYTDQSSAGGVKWGQGSGHSWVSDGFIENYDENGVMTNLFYHMNWGWNNLYNGWFTLGNWAIYTSSGTLYKNYQYCQDLVINIHP